MTGNSEGIDLFFEISTYKRPSVDRSDQLPDERILFCNPTVCEYAVRTQELRIPIYRWGGHALQFYIPVPIVKIFPTVACFYSFLGI